MNNVAQKVYPTGAFAIQLDLQQGNNQFKLIAKNKSGKSTTKIINYNYTEPAPPQPVTSFSIAYVQTFPSGDLIVAPGDKIQFRVKAQPGGEVAVEDKFRLQEIPLGGTQQMPGIYQGTYTVQCNDPLINGGRLNIVLRNNNQSVAKRTESTYTLLNTNEQPLIGKTKGELPYLEYGLGDDRLGGAKMGYLDTAVLLSITGKVGDEYRVKLSSTLSAYIPSEMVELLPGGTFPPRSNTGSWKVYGDDKFDYVSIGLSCKLPYRSIQEINPSKIIVDVYGATSNTNWITQLQNVQEIKNVYYDQKEDGVFRVIIELKHEQHWGHQVYYDGNTLMIKVKRPPQSKDIKGLTIAVDAGHGGRNRGSRGPTGVYEKDMTLAISKIVAKKLEDEGVNVLMTRVNDSYVDNRYRIVYYQEKDPDLLISIHTNSSADPIRVEGTSTYYKHIGFRDLSTSIYKKMLGTGLKEFGNVGSFNFALNAPTEYPNALVETLFISNPEDEMKVLDPAFREKMADEIIAGIKDFVKNAR